MGVFPRLHLARGTAERKRPKLFRTLTGDSILFHTLLPLPGRKRRTFISPPSWTPWRSAMQWTWWRSWRQHSEGWCTAAHACPAGAPWWSDGLTLCPATRTACCSRSCGWTAARRPVQSPGCKLARSAPSSSTGTCRCGNASAPRPGTGGRGRRCRRYV